MNKKKLIEMDAELYKKVEKSAKDNDRSINKEINFRLKKSFNKK
jgi:hypothetical protein